MYDRLVVLLRKLRDLLFFSAAGLTIAMIKILFRKH
jgi:hypothetical protein